MKHLGDITKLTGYDLPLVDCITGGSPCQDLSVAGKRKGLAGERSGLFLEQIRIIKEMREHDRRNKGSDVNIRPRYMVWENVKGALSSPGKKGGEDHRGEDFRAVLTEIVRIAEPDAPDVPLPEKRKWPKAGCLYDELGGWSIAWRVHDTQFWGAAQSADGRMLTAGTPQRRERIALVADFAGLSAPEVLFERSGLRRDPSPQQEKKQETAGGTGESTNKAISFQERAGKPGGGKGILIQEEKTGAISTVNNQSVFQSKTICLQGNAIDRADTAGCNGKGWNDEDVSYTLNTIDRPAVFAAGFDGNQGSAAQGIGYEEEKAATIIAGRSKNVLVLNDQGGEYMNVSENITGTLRAESRGHEPICVEMTSTKNRIIENGVCPTLTARMGTGGNQVNAICMDVGFFQTEEEKVGALLARQYKDPPITYQQTTGAPLASGYSKNGTQEDTNDMCVVRGDGVFRLTPLECERLQGFPDGWTDIGEWADTKGKTHKPSDGPRYRALGNSIALPFWFWLLRRISAQYERPATMASLFDGIGGFPLCWERCNGKGTAIWASEIEEFPIAVTKKRFPEE